ncbi:MAG TPA: hypothetical protein VFI37_08370, partial [Gaiellaceae bacterium]|nr:hypothetical protein [Gaiellaceae bacterium]
MSEQRPTQASGRTSEGTGFFAEAVHNRFLLGVAAVAALGGLLFGFDTGVVGGALLFFKQDLSLDKG